MSLSKASSERSERREGQGMRHVGHSFLPRRSALEMHSLQKRCRHWLGLRVGVGGGVLGCEGEFICVCVCAMLWGCLLSLCALFTSV